MTWLSPPFFARAPEPPPANTAKNKAIIAPILYLFSPAHFVIFLSTSFLSLFNLSNSSCKLLIYSFVFCFASSSVSSFDLSSSIFFSNAAIFSSLVYSVMSIIYLKLLILLDYCEYSIFSDLI